MTCQKADGRLPFLTLIPASFLCSNLICSCMNLIFMRFFPRSIFRCEMWVLTVESCGLVSRRSMWPEFNNQCFFIPTNTEYYLLLQISIFNWKLFQSLTFFLNLLIFFTFFAIIGTIPMASQFSSLGPYDRLGYASNTGQSLLLSLTINAIVLWSTAQKLLCFGSDFFITVMILLSWDRQKRGTYSFLHVRFKCSKILEHSRV